MKMKRILSLFLLITMIAGIFAGCATDNISAGDKNTLADFKTASIGIMTGSSHDGTAKEIFPDAKRVYFNTVADMVLATEQGKIDGYIEDAPFLISALWEGSSIKRLDESIKQVNNGFAFPQSEESRTLREQVNAFIAASKADGTLDALLEKWLSDTEPTEHPDYMSLSGENGTIRLAVTVENKPAVYLKNEFCTGFEMEFLTRFAQQYGYNFEIEAVPFGSVIAGISAGKYDMAAASLNITPEREESVDFSDPYTSFDVVMVVKGDGTKNTEMTLADLETATIGVITGSAHNGLVDKNFPNAKKINFNLIADMILAVQQGKIDCYIEDAPFMAPLLWEGVGVKSVDEAVAQVENGFVFPQSEESHELRRQINAFLAEVKADGTIDRLIQKWMGDTEPTEHPKYSQLTGENGTIHLAISVDNKPILYQNAEGYTGFEMELLTLFGQQAGYAFDIEVVPFESIIAGISSGKYDMGASTLNITPEREESVDFSDPYASFDVVMVIKGEAEQKQNESVSKLSDLATATLGIVTGHSWDLIAQKNYPNAERKYFGSEADALLALSQRKIDALLVDKTVYAGVRWENSSISCIDESIGQVSNALIFAKEGYDENLLDQINAFIAKAKENGTLERLAAKWFGDTEPDEHPDYTGLSGTNGTLRIAVCEGQRPVTYLKGTMYTGYEVDFLTLFAEEYGYKLDLQGMSFDALIPSVASGKCDIGACGITITPERAENVTFSDPHFETYGVAIVRAEKSSSGGEIALTDFNNAKIGIHTGSIYDTYARERFPNAELAYYNLLSDMMVALEQGKIDGFISETTYITGAIWEGAKIKSVAEPIDYTNAAYVFQKGEASAQLREQINEFIRKSKENGALDNLRAKWLGATEPTEVPDYKSLTGENGTIRVAMAPDVKPITYIKDGEPTGYEIELLVMFAKEYGYKLDISYMSFEAVLPGVTTGKYDIGTGAITITEERAESLDFSESHLTDDVIMVIKAEDEPSVTQPGFWDEVKEDFRKTFIRENRWKLIVEGIGVTMLISICAAAAGSLLGFGLYMLSRADMKALRLLAKGVAKVYSRIIAGTPVVVILMILFYVIFGKVRDMSGIVVAIIGFTLTFGAFVYDHMTVSVNSVDRGQTEAAYALGYTKTKTFFRIIFPQAMSIFLPSYCGQAVELIKATAVVGYVAVNDLTKMGDIIRSNTYEAFFPLIATAVIYFMLTWMLSALLGLVKRRYEPKRRSAEMILKGVKRK